MSLEVSKPTPKPFAMRRTSYQPLGQNKKSQQHPEVNSKEGHLATLNLEYIKKPSFHEEFMSKIDEYSNSWREAVMKEKRF
jgi:hypothetical protein